MYFKLTSVNMMLGVLDGKQCPQIMNTIILLDKIFLFKVLKNYRRRSDCFKLSVSVNVSVNGCLSL